MPSVGLTIYSLIRFSRKMLWLKVTPTNHDPKVVGRFYLECVESVGGMG